MAYIAGWQEHHHHQLCFYKSREKLESREVEINIKYKINITLEKRVEIAETLGKDCARGKKRPGVR